MGRGGGLEDMWRLKSRHQTRFAALYGKWNLYKVVNSGYCIDLMKSNILDSKGKTEAIPEVKCEQTEEPQKYNNNIYKKTNRFVLWQYS